MLKIAALICVATIAFAVIAIGVASVTIRPGTFSVVELPAASSHDYPSPSYWPQSPYPMGTPRLDPAPPVTISPCPAWAPSLIRRADGVYECRGAIPPDPHTGPVCAPPGPPVGCVEPSNRPSGTR